MTRVTVVHRVCERYRLPTLRMLGELEEIDLTLLHGRSIPGTKVKNAVEIEGFAAVEMPTLSRVVTSDGRKIPMAISPPLPWHLARLNPDVIIAEGGSNVFNNVLLFAYAKLSRTPIVWWTLGSLEGRSFTGIRRLYRRTVQWMETHSTALLGYSSKAMEYFQAMGYQEDRCFIAVNSVMIGAPERLPATGIRLLSASRPDIDWQTRRIVLYSGVLEKTKRVDRLLHALSRVAPRHPQMHLVIIGDGPERSDIEDLVADLGLGHAVTLVGQMYDGVGAIFDAADFFVLPGLGGRAISQAMGHGLPVICAQADGTEIDYVENGFTGFRIDSSEQEDVTEFFSSHMNLLATQEELRLRMGRNAQKRAVEELGTQASVAAIADAVAFARHGARSR